jgi:hypothetical protein
LTRPDLGEQRHNALVVLSFAGDAGSNMNLSDAADWAVNQLDRLGV